MSEKKDKTIFRKILLPLLSVLVLEMLFMLGAFLLGGVFKRLNDNATDMLAQQTENRGNYLFNDMVGNWANLDMLSEEIDKAVQLCLDEGQLSLEDLNDGSKCTELLKGICPELINAMYNKQISGIFVLFNTHSLAEEPLPETLPGIYLRDLDPTSTPSERNADLLWERAPVGVVQSGYIATDTGWQPAFSEEDSIGKDFFYKPFRAASEDERGLREKEYGYWTTRPYSLSGDERAAISYSVPLILEDGTVYGVLGVELLTDYVQSLLPNQELSENRQGSYLLAVGTEEEPCLRPVVLSSEILELPDIEEKSFALMGQKDYAGDEEGKYYASVKPLVVYSNHAPFDADKWYLLGISPKESLFAFSRQVQTLLCFSIILTAAVGLAGILLASYRLSKPIRRLSGEVARAQEDNCLPALSLTGIREIDQFAESISRLGREVVESSTRLLSIMDMASVELAGYELQEDSESVYVTDNYFPLLGVEGIDTGKLTPAEFLDLRKKLHRSLEHFHAEDGSVVYTVLRKDGSVRYFRSVRQEKNGRQVGLIEDVTFSTLEKKRIEKERDSDGLTKLYARRGFTRETEALFRKPQSLKHAGLLMIDLDNLKTTNDRFGHNLGDEYIQTAGRCFLENTPADTLCARMSGDEFILFFYGYDSREEIRDRVAELYRAIHGISFVLPNGDDIGLSASGGIAWYPEDSDHLSELMKYADFAMYQVKRSQKGEYREFDRKVFEEQEARNQSRLEFYKMLKTRDVNYFFQPIFESRGGGVYAYEALMRVNHPFLRSPETVLRLAREEGRMHEMEYITLFRSAECYRALLEKKAVSEEALVFVNSIANERLTCEEEQLYHESFADLQSRVVVEITETEQLDMELINQKSCVEGFSGTFALDDYGSGYNSEINLLKLQPKYVKVDITIVRDVDTDVNKQQIIRNIVDYGHRRDMMIIAEGLETAGELKTVLELGVDLLQGYFLARPGEVPPAISPEALRVITDYRNR